MEFWARGPQPKGHDETCEPLYMSLSSCWLQKKRSLLLTVVNVKHKNMPFELSLTTGR